MEVRAENSKIMTSSTNRNSADISTNGQKLGRNVLGRNHVQRWYLLSRNPYQNCLSNSSDGQIKQDPAEKYQKLRKQMQVTQVSDHFHLLLWLQDKEHACWLIKRIQAFKTKFLRKLLCISYLEHKTKDWVQSEINILVGRQERLLATLKRRKLEWFRYIKHTGMTSRKPFFWAAWRVGDSVVGRGNVG